MCAADMLMSTGRTTLASVLHTHYVPKCIASDMYTGIMLYYEFDELFLRIVCIFI